ncbi:hypothetical protein Cgig2_014461 [Carnegiea gigantea]|uniref:Uncharacterized protein n=1 Tax=Carnegiea gigantea TaxID=171969 RepID=A0A9Q1K9Z9_9CARY|nr:hypothetical protein Cgig2_014461 [Carnegiea gigantea]
MVIDDAEIVIPHPEVLKRKVKGKDARGRSGGLATLWDKRVNLILLSCSSHLDSEIQRGAEEPNWRFISVYGRSETQYKYKTWSIIGDLKSHSDLPWLASGDLNKIFYHKENRGGPPKPQAYVDRFRNAFLNSELFNLGFTGYEITWCNNQEGEEEMEE